MRQTNMQTSNKREAVSHTVGRTDPSLCIGVDLAGRMASAEGGLCRVGWDMERGVHSTAE